MLHPVMVFTSGFGIIRFRECDCFASATLCSPSVVLSGVFAKYAPSFFPAPVRSFSFWSYTPPFCSQRSLIMSEAPKMALHMK